MADGNGVGQQVRTQNESCKQRQLKAAGWEREHRRHLLDYVAENKILSVLRANETRSAGQLLRGRGPKYFRSLDPCPMIKNRFPRLNTIASRSTITNLF